VGEGRRWAADGEIWLGRSTGEWCGEIWLGTSQVSLIHAWPVSVNFRQPPNSRRNLYPLSSAPLADGSYGSNFRQLIVADRNCLTSVSFPRADEIYLDQRKFLFFL
jgi:hypothetical protein